MEETANNAKALNYSAIAEMSGTEGFKEIEKMLEWDVKFSQGLLEGGRDKQFITDAHEIGRARGILFTAKKYLNLVKSARTKNIS